MSDKLFIGVDVGTGSARAGVFTATGEMLASAKRDIALYRIGAEIAEQSSENIWQAVCTSVREAVAQIDNGPGRVAGIGFDATCSLVLAKKDGGPVTVSSTGEADRNIIVWMDHRATQQAERINKTGHAVLSFVGGAISPEMETPKLLWLSENMPESFAAADHFFDLTDYLTWRATGSLARSICTLSCKWTYLSHENRWDETYFNEIGLGALAEEAFVRIGTQVVEPGTALGAGLNAATAVDFGLLPGTRVGAGLIDAHAGGIATVGLDPASGRIERTLAYVLGTSACTMVSTPQPAYVNGVWGPYFSAMVPGMWLSEGGQSAAGAAIDQLIRSHPAYQQAADEAERVGLSAVDWLTRKAEKADLDVLFANAPHVVPDFNGNRAPFADPHARAVISGLSLDRSIGSLVAFYAAGVCSLGYGLRQIIDAMATSDVTIDTVVISGGAGRSKFVQQLLADATGIVIAATAATEPVLLGSAMLGAVASGEYANLPEAMRMMTRLQTRTYPQEGFVANHSHRYAVFGLLQRAELESRRLGSALAHAAYPGQI